MSTDKQQIGNQSNRKWGKSACFVCGKLVSTCGLGFVSHMRKHVRQGKIAENWSTDGNHREFSWIGIWKEES